MTLRFALRLLRPGVAFVLIVMQVLPAAVAHPGDKGFATITVSGTSVHYAYTLPLSSLHADVAQSIGIPSVEAGADFRPLADIVREKIAVSLGNQRCLAGPPLLTSPGLGNAGVTITMEYNCAEAAPRTLEVRDQLTDLFGPTYATLATLQWPGGSQSFAFQRDTQTARVAMSQGASGQGFRSFFLLGVEHIIIGWDHLLFLLCLLLGGGRLGRLVQVVTAFTVGHSVTLIAAALDVVAISSRIVESAIALSIAYVAAENILLRGRSMSMRWLVALVFGFVHGFGFASVLTETGLPRETLIWSLLAFNLGVEAGQLMVVGCAIPLLASLQQAAWRVGAITAVSGIVFIVGLALFVHRALP